MPLVLFLLDFGDVTDECFIINILQQTLQLVKIANEILSDSLRNDFSQTRVAHQQEATGSDAIGLVLELLWLHLIEIFEDGGYKDLRVDPGHTIDSVGAQRSSRTRPM